MKNRVKFFYAVYYLVVAVIFYVKHLFYIRRFGFAAIADAELNSLPHHRKSFYNFKNNGPLRLGVYVNIR